LYRATRIIPRVGLSAVATPSSLLFFHIIYSNKNLHLKFFFLFTSFLWVLCQMFLIIRIETNCLSRGIIRLKTTKNSTIVMLDFFQKVRVVIYLCT
jgi:hypothetical protein